MSALLWTLIGLPTAAGAMLALSGRRTERIAPAAGVLVAAVALGLAVATALVRPAASVAFLPDAPLTLAVDDLAAVVLVTVAAVGLLVLVAAAAEITEGRARFFGLMLLFLAAVLLTVTATTLSGLLLAWEIMGATSWALIGHQRDQGQRVVSGTTAFLVTRAGDVGLYLAAGAALAAGAGLDLGGLDGLAAPWLHVAAAGVLAASFGKAAQLPFSFWLSRAMDGPSPVSALLHSAAMVAMGGYLLLRLAPLLDTAGWAAGVAAWGGALTALVLGAVALAQSDLKQLLAASTGAQLGFVVLGAGTAAHGGISAGTAHLVGHAAVKALLFLAAGAWLAALGTKDLAALRGAARTYRAVGATFAVGALALAGVPPLALWATKDAVLTAAAARSPGLFLVALAAAALSAGYAGKAIGLLLRPPPAQVEVHYDTEQRGHRRVGALVTAPLVVLAAGAAGLGALVLSPVVAVLPGGPVPTSVTGLVLAGLLALAVTGLAAAAPDRLPSPGWARTWLGLEAATHAAVVRPVLTLARGLARFDDQVLDRAVTGSAAGARWVASRAARADERDVDGVVRGLAGTAWRLGELARRPQTGQLHQYYAQAAVALAAAVILLLVVR